MHFQVEAPRISGGGQTTLDEAREAATKAFAVEGAGRRSGPGPVEYLEVAVGTEASPRTRYWTALGLMEAQQLRGRRL